MKHLKPIFLLFFFIVLMHPLTAFPVSVDKVAFESEKGVVVDGNEAFLISSVVVYINLLDISTGKLDRLTLDSVNLAPDSDIAFTRDRNMAFLPLRDSVAVIDVVSKRVHEVSTGAEVFTSDNYIVKTRDCSKTLLNKLIDKPELKVVIDRDAAFTPDCAKAIFLSSANTSVVIVDIASEKVEMVRLEGVIFRPGSKVSITPDGDTAFFLSYPYDTDNLLYGYGASDSGSECVMCDLFVPVSGGPMGNVTWSKVGSNSGGNPFSVLPSVPSKDTGQPVSDVPDGGEGDNTDPENGESGLTETDDGDPDLDNTNDGEADLDPNNLSDPGDYTYNLNPPPIPDNEDYYPPTVPGYTDSVTPIPEPRTLILLSSGLIGLIWLVRKLKAES